MTTRAILAIREGSGESRGLISREWYLRDLSPITVSNGMFSMTTLAILAIREGSGESRGLISWELYLRAVSPITPLPVNRRCGAIHVLILARVEWRLNLS